MTGRTAAVFGLQQRGTIRPGNYADLVLFDPATVADRATYKTPTLTSLGIHRVWNNGEATLNAEGLTGAAPGRFLRNPRLAA